LPESDLRTAIHLRIAPELRRCAVYAVIGALLIAIVAVWATHFVEKRPAFNTAVECAVCLMLALAMLVPLRWALRIDHRGVARRLLIGWDLWTWSDFGSGRIRKRHPYTLVDPERPPWWRSLRLGHMSQSDIKQALELINTQYRLPDLPQLSDTLAIKYSLRRSARLDQQGLHLLVAGRPHEYLWNEVRRVHITRMDPVRRDFRSLRITLPDQEIELRLVTHQGGTSPTWRGAAPEEVNEFLCRHVPADRIDEDVYGERPARRTDLERQLTEVRKRLRDLRIMAWVFSALIMVWFISAGLGKGVVPALIVAAMATACGGGLIGFLRRDLRKRCLDLEALAATYNDNGGGICQANSARNQPEDGPRLA
jgi:hypothetical protein